VVSFLSEGSVGAGVRRVEALVGADAYRFLAREHLIVSQLAELTKVRPEELPERINSIMERLKNAERDIAKAKSASLLSNLEALIGTATVIGNTNVYLVTLPDETDAGMLREATTRANSLVKSNNNVIVLATTSPDKVSMIVATDNAARDAGLSADELLKKALGAMGGKGGGNAALAQGGAPTGDLSNAFAAVVTSLGSN
jgi:alanyl-tRNA synthetase